MATTKTDEQIEREEWADRMSRDFDREGISIMAARSNGPFVLDVARLSREEAEACVAAVVRIRNLPRKQ